MDLTFIEFLPLSAYPHFEPDHILAAFHVPELGAVHAGGSFAVFWLATIGQLPMVMARPGSRFSSYER